MNSLARFVGLDLRSLRPVARAFLFSTTLVVVAAVIPLGSPYPIIPAMAMLVLLLVPQQLFGNDERGKLDTLYAALGIRRARVVAGRYATSLVSVLAAMLAGVLLAPLFALTLRTDFDWRTGIVLAFASLAAIGTVFAAELPVYFALGASRARSTGVAIHVALIGIVVVIGVAFPAVGTWLVAMVDSVPIALVAAITLAVVLAVGIASLRLAARLYVRRDIR